MLLSASFICAQTFPTRPIRFIVPFPPGGGNDVMARVIAQKFTDAFGQQVVIDNRAGAGGNVGAELAAKTPPDGYTLLAANNSLIVNASLYRKLPYDPVKDFSHAAMIGTTPNAFFVSSTILASSSL